MMNSKNGWCSNDIRSVAIDLGAGSGRLVEGRIAGDKWVLNELSRFRTPMIDDAETGYQCWEIDEIFEQIYSSLGKAASACPIASVGVDSWGVDFVLLDADCNRVGKAVCYRDKRNPPAMDRMLKRIAPEEIYRRTGIQFQPFNTLYQLAATVDEQPQWLEAAHHLLMIPDYLNYCLCGVLANEYTNATTTQVLNQNGEWDETLERAAGLKRRLMSKPIEAATVLGQTKFNSGSITVVAPATHDTASAVLGAPLESADEAYISCGTWSLMGIESRTAFTGKEAMRMNFTNEGGMERRFRVLKNIMGMWPFQRVCEEHNVTDLGALDAEVERLPGWRSIVNPDERLFLNPTSMTEAIRGYCRQMGQPEPRTVAELARCIFDSLALSYRSVKEELETLRQRPLAKIRMIGGGSKNRLLNKLCADASGLAVAAGPVEASALGNLSAQMIALGHVKDVDAARTLIRASFPIEEFRPQAPVPDAVYQNFQQLLKAKYEGE
jgi:rhamnulokinase